MKIAIIAGWILLAIETALVLYMFVQPNVGDDAAGRGMALGFGIVLGPVLLISAALFIWGQRGGPRVAFWTGFSSTARSSRSAPSGPSSASAAGISRRATPTARPCGKPIAISSLPVIPAGV